jgi:hypothetical protein
MSSTQISEMTQSKRNRLAFIELRVRSVGEIRRQDLVARFDIHAASATRDIGLKLGRTEDAVRAKAGENNVWLNPTNQSPYNRRKR